MDKVVLFDLHGTLEQGTSDATEEAVNLGFEYMGLEGRITIEQVNTLFGRKYPYKFIEAVYPNLSPEEVDIMARYIFSVEADIIKKHVRPNDYAVEVLAELHARGYENKILSNAQQSHLEGMFMPVLDFGKYVSEVIGVDGMKSYNGIPLNGNVVERKASVIMLTEGSVCMVGDRSTDMKAGRKAGVTTVHYQNAYISDEEMKEGNADYKIKCLSKLLDILL